MKTVLHNKHRNAQTAEGIRMKKEHNSNLQRRLSSIQLVTQAKSFSDIWGIKLRKYRNFKERGKKCLGQVCQGLNVSPCSV